MVDHASPLTQQLAAHFPTTPISVDPASGEVTLKVAADNWLAHAMVLRNALDFEQLTDLCVVDYLGYGAAEWDTQSVSSLGFSRAVAGQTIGRFKDGQAPLAQAPEGMRMLEPLSQRFAVVAHLRSYKNNVWIRIQCFATDDVLPRVASLTSVWPGADWYEREAFDLFGVVFDGHPDLRRIVTDYGFVGHPFRKDFPLSGNVEVRYDPTLQRVVYEPVQSVQPRVGVARVVRHPSEPAQSSAKPTSNGAQ